jgi:hypothetical protein
MSPDREIYSPGPSSTPGPSDFLSDTNDTPHHHQPQPIAQICQPGHQPRRAKISSSTASETWEMLSDSGASLLSPQNDGKSDSMRSWKSARNGQKLDEFGGESNMSQSTQADV